MDSLEVADVATMTGRLAYLVTFGGWIRDIGMPQRAADILSAMKLVVEQGKAPSDAGGPAVGAPYQPPATVPPATPAS